VAELGLFIRFCRARIRGEMQYRAAFVAFSISQTVVTFLDCVAVLAIFSQVDALGGWSRGEVLFIYSTSVLSFGLADFTFGSVEYAAVTVIDGSFDGFLVRPAGVMTQLLGSFFALRRFGRLFQCLIVLAFVFGSGDVSIGSPITALFAVAMVIGGALTFSAIFVITNTVGFFIPGAREFANAFTYGGNAAAGYPSHIFGNWMRNFIMWVLPAGFVSYVPSLYVLDAENPLNVPRWLQLASPLACIPIGLFAAVVWRSGVRHYESTGS
jgi:ABC-2 type transport system permease protein